MLLLAHLWSPPTPAQRELFCFLAAKCSIMFNAGQMSMLRNRRAISMNTAAWYSWERCKYEQQNWTKTRKSCRRGNQNSNLKDAKWGKLHHTRFCPTLAIWHIVFDTFVCRSTAESAAQQLLLLPLNHDSIVYKPECHYILWAASII